MIKVERFITRDPLYLVSPKELSSSVKGIKDDGVKIADPDTLDVHHAYTEDLTEDKMWTENAEKCLAIAVLGIIDSGNTLGFMFHVAPGAFEVAPAEANTFVKKYRTLLDKLSEKTASSSIISVIAGGRINNKDLDKYYHVSEMTEAIRSQNNKHGIKSVVLPPKQLSSEMSHVYVDTPARHITVIETYIKGAPTGILLRI